MSHPRQLLRLQEIDRTIEAIKASISDLTGRLGVSTELSDARCRAGDLEKKLHGLQSAQRDKDLELQGVSNKLAASKERLYGGNIRNPKELKGLEEEAISLKGRESALEDQLLEIMVQVEETRSSLEQASRELGLLETQWAAGQKQIEEELQSLDVRMAEIVNSRAHLEKRLDETDLRTYEELRRRKGTNPVVRLRGDTCQGCGVSLPVAIARKVRDSDELILCTSCGRLLVDE